MPAFRPFFTACVFLPLLIAIAGCVGLGPSKPALQYAPTAPTEDGVPAPVTLYVYNNSYHCKYTVKIGAAQPIDLGFNEYLFAEVWPGTTPASFLRSNARLISGCDEYKDKWLQSDIRLPAKTGLDRPFLHASLGEVTDHTHPRFRAIVQSDFKLVAALTIAQTTPSQQFRGYAYYGPPPQQGHDVTGRVQLPSGMFTGTIRGNSLVNGELRQKDGGVYMGEFNDLTFSGSGTLVSANGEVYTGSFSNGRANGEGVCTRPGGAPEYCFKKSGAPAPIPTLEQMAKENLERIEKQEREQQATQAQADIKASETRISSLHRDRQTVPQRVKSEKVTMIKQCECFVRDAPWFKGCLFLTDKDSSWEQRQAEKRARDRTDAACENWWDRTKGLSDDEIIKAELARIGTDLSNETAALARKKRQAEAEHITLLRKQEAERAQRLAQQRAEEKTRRDELLAKRERECKEQIARQPFSCGCNVYRPKSAPANKPRSSGTACPA